MGVLDLIARPVPASEPAAGERRCGVRVSVDLAGALSLDGETIEVTVRDLSNGGARVEAGVRLSVGERFVLRIEGWPPTPVVVRWVQNDRAGLAFAG